MQMETLYDRIRKERSARRLAAVKAELSEKEAAIRAFLSDMIRLSPGTDCAAILRQVEDIADDLKSVCARLDGQSGEVGLPSSGGRLNEALDRLLDIARDRLSDYEGKCGTLQSEYTDYMERMGQAFREIRAAHLAQLEQRFLSPGAELALLGGLSETAVSDLFRPLEFKAAARKTAAIQHQSLAHLNGVWKKLCSPTENGPADGGVQPLEFPTAEAVQACFHQPLSDILEDFGAAIFADPDAASFHDRVLSASAATCDAIFRESVDCLENTAKEAYLFWTESLTRDTARVLFAPDYAKEVHQAILDLRRRLRVPRTETEPSLRATLTGNGHDA